MTKLKKTIQEITTKEVDVEFPHFTKHGEKLFAIVSEKDVWEVNAYDFRKGVEINELSTSNALSYPACTGEEFLAAYEKCMKEISNLPIERPLFK